MAGDIQNQSGIRSIRLQGRLDAVESYLPFALSLPLAMLYLLFLGLPLATIVQLSLQGETLWSNYVAVFTEAGVHACACVCMHLCRSLIYEAGSVRR